MLRSDYKTHYKMYKAKKNVVYATMFTFAMLGGLGLTQTAKADTTENPVNQPAVQTTVNSTAQATSQAVANSAVSAVASASQVSSASSSVSSAAPVAQTSQPASTAAVNTFNAARNSTPITNVAQSFVQTNSQKQVTNLNVAFTDDPTLYNHQNANQHDATVIAGNSYVIGIKGSFDVNSNYIKADGDAIKIGDFTQTNNPNTNDNGVSVQYDLSGQPIKYNGQTIGFLDVKANGKNNAGVYLKPTANINAVGQIHINFDMPNGLLIDHNSPATNIVGNSYPQQHIFKFGDAVFTLILTAPTYTEVEHYQNPQAQWTNSSHSSPSYAIKSSAQLIWFTSGQFNSMLDSNGQNVSSLPDSYQYGAHIVPHTSILNVKSFYGIYAEPIDPVTHKMMISNGSETYIRWAETKNSTRVTDNKSVAELKAMNIDGLSYSYQSDSSINLWVNMSRQELAANPAEWDAWSKSTYYQTLPGQTQETVSKAIKDYYEKGALQGLPPYISNQIYLGVADPTIKNSATITYYDRNLSTNINNNPALVETVPSSSMASGQSAVKLHVINATNGADLKHLIHFVISPVN